MIEESKVSYFNESMSKQYKYAKSLSDFAINHLKNNILSQIKNILEYGKVEDFEDIFLVKMRIIQNIETIFNNCPKLDEPIIVYRNVQNSTWINEFKSYTHTTFSYNSTNFSNGIILKITLPPGTKIIPLDELILDRTNLYIQGSSEMKDGIEIINVTFIPDENKEVIKVKNFIKGNSSNDTWYQFLYTLYEYGLLDILPKNDPQRIRAEELIKKDNWQMKY